MIAIAQDKFTIYWEGWYWEVVRPFGGYSTAGFRTFERAVAYMDSLIPQYEEAILAGWFQEDEAA
jgi:hypothetical protein